MASSRDWLVFFLDANVPKAAAAQYAKSFAENRISMDMLMDLNKEYLRDLGIVILGDIIAILKHAKQVQGSLTNPEKKEADLIKAKRTEVTPDLPAKKEISRRLGPPKPIFFDQKPDSTPSQVKSAPEPNVFDRLEPNNHLKSPCAHDRVGPKVNEGSRRTVIETGKSQCLIRKRVEAPPPDRSDEDPLPRRITIRKTVSQEKRLQEEVEEEFVGRKRFIMVTKRPDGTQTRTVLDPKDPRIREIGVSKKLYIPMAGFKRETDRPPVTAVKRKRIAAPDPDDSEPKPVSSRLGDRLGPSRSPAPGSISPQQPVARKRIHGPSDSPRRPSVMDRLEFGHQSGDGARITNRLGPRIHRIKY